MIRIVDKHNCCGCAACQQRCPIQCISMTEDAEGFLYPSVDTEKCVGCGLCESVCPELNHFEQRIPLQTLAGVNKDEQIRFLSSSGGMFTLLAEKVIDDGGVVFGARFDERWQVVIDCSETKEGLAPFRGSKYLQAQTGESFIRCEQFLKMGRTVLYSGTPCQIAGLNHFLKTEYENLITVDVVCHGVPSPKVWRMYLDEVVGTAIVRSVSMRDKVNGWQNYCFTVSYEDGGRLLTLSLPKDKNDYMDAFLKNLILRPSCYQCSMRGLCSGSDITLGDYWGIDNVHPEMNDNRGVCLVLVNTETGKKVLGSVDFRFEESAFEEACNGNSIIYSSPRPWFRRQRFFDNLDICPSVTSNIRACLKPSLKMMVNNAYLNLKHLPCRIVALFARNESDER